MANHHHIFPIVNVSLFFDDRVHCDTPAHIPCMAEVLRHWGHCIRMLSVRRTGCCALFSQSCASKGFLSHLATRFYFDSLVLHVSHASICRDFLYMCMPLTVPAAARLFSSRIAKRSHPTRSRAEQLKSELNESSTSAIINLLHHTMMGPCGINRQDHQQWRRGKNPRGPQRRQVIPLRQQFQ